MTLLRLQLVVVALLASNVCFAQTKSTPERGKDLFGRDCVGCHSVTCNRNGPKLEGLFGRTAGSVPGFNYTPELKASGIVWTDETLNAFLTDPNKLVPGTAMANWGRIANANERKDLIAYLRREDRAFDLCPKS
jgi:cytochrome c